MPDDATLLLRYANERSNDAFGELVRRHLGLVYHAALRQCQGDAHRAEDVTQTVFIALARKAAEVAGRPSLAGWLYTSTRYAAIQEIRSETRRAERELGSLDMNPAPQAAEGPVDWDTVRPALDDSLCELSEPEREAVLLRYFEGRAFAEIGDRLQVSEDAARMRVDRALEKLRTVLSGRGITSSMAALGVLLTEQAGAAVPAGLASSVTSAAVATMAPVATATLLMSITKLQGSLILAAVVAGSGVFIYQARSNARLKAEVATLRSANEAALSQGSTSSNGGTDAAASKPLGGSAGANAAAPKRSAKSIAAQSAALAQGLVPSESLGNCGLATPRNAFSTQIWAARTGDVDLEASTLMLSPDARAKLQALEASLPPDFQAQYDTPEKLMAFALAGSPHPVGGIDVLSETSDGPTDTSLQIEWQHTDDSIVHNSDAQLHLDGDTWKWEVPDALVNRAAAYLSRSAQSASGGGK